MLTFYRWLGPFFIALLQIYATFSPTMREFLDGRRGLMERWKKADLGQGVRVWFHVSSVGELEQVRPVIEAMGRLRPDVTVLLSFFSSSVPRLVKNWQFVKYADYLPLDLQGDMEALVNQLKPQLLVLNRYDLWPNHLAALRKNHVPIVLINASTPPIGFIGWLGLKLRQKMFRVISAWTFVDSTAAAAWEPFMAPHARGSVLGNPRVDRALQRVEQAMAEGKTKERLRGWQARKNCLVAGSTWAADEDLLLSLWGTLGERQNSASLVVVPHEPTEDHLKSLESKLKRQKLSYLRYSQLPTHEKIEVDVLLVDQRGFLAEIYSYGQAAYVGGGFGRQIHSPIEPIAHHLPVAFGPHFSRTPEAITLCATGVARKINTSHDDLALKSWLIEAWDHGLRHLESDALKVFLQVHRGAGDRVAEFLFQCLK